MVLDPFAETGTENNDEKTVLTGICTVAVFLAAYVSTGGGGEGISLAEAIEQSAEKICADLPTGSRVTFVAW